MSIFKEFEEFSLRGSVVDLAVGVIIGAAFGAIVTSLVKDILMPPLGLLTGGVDFSNISIVLKHADVVAKKPEVAIRIGNFLNIIFQFLIISFSIFAMVKGINTLKRRQAEGLAPLPEAAPSKEEVLLTEIRDLLAKGK